MKEVALFLEEMQKRGVILAHALFGATAQMRYTEPVATLDADVLVILPDMTALDLLAPIYRYAESRGYAAQGEAIVVGRWPVQFVPVFSPLTEEAVRQAETGDMGGIGIRVVRAVHLAVIALSVGRPKDHLRILALLESGATSKPEIEEMAERFGLGGQWRRFQERYLDA